MFSPAYFSINGKKYRLAPYWRRFGAALIDIVVFSSLLFVRFANWALMLGYGMTRDSWPFLRGRSIGKMIFNIRVLSYMTGHDLKGDYPSGINRNLPLAFLFLDLFVIFFTKNRQRFGDMWARTVVVVDSKDLRNYNRIVKRNPKRFVSIHEESEFIIPWK